MLLCLLQNCKSSQVRGARLLIPPLLTARTRKSSQRRKSGISSHAVCRDHGAEIEYPWCHSRCPTHAFRICVSLLDDAYGGAWLCVLFCSKGGSPSCLLPTTRTNASHHQPPEYRARGCVVLTVSEIKFLSIPSAPRMLARLLDTAYNAHCGSLRGCILLKRGRPPPLTRTSTPLLANVSRLRQDRAMERAVLTETGIPQFLCPPLIARLLVAARSNTNGEAPRCTPLH